MTSFVSYLLIPSFGLALIGFIILFKTYRIDEKPNPLKIRNGVLLFGQVFVLAIILIVSDSANDKRARTDLKALLTQTNLQVSLNNEILDSVKSKQLIDVLKTIEKIEAHHSHSTERIPIVITSQRDTLVLQIGQDSNYPTEYWLFADKYDQTEIGRVRTSLNIKNGL